MIRYSLGLRAQPGGGRVTVEVNHQLGVGKGQLFLTILLVELRPQSWLSTFDDYCSLISLLLTDHQPPTPVYELSQGSNHQLRVGHWESIQKLCIMNFSYCIIIGLFFFVDHTIIISMVCVCMLKVGYMYIICCTVICTCDPPLHC